MLGLIETCDCGSLRRFLLLKLVLKLLSSVEIVISGPILHLILIESRSPFLFDELTIAGLIQHLRGIFDPYDFVLLHSLRSQEVSQYQIVGGRKLRNLLEFVDVLSERSHVSR